MDPNASSAQSLDVLQQHVLSENAEYAGPTPFISLHAFDDVWGSLQEGRARMGFSTCGASLERIEEL
jgi:hypothetical protein